MRLGPTGTASADSPSAELLVPAGAGALLTQVPIGSPAMARSMFPSFLKLNTRIGKLVLQAHADGRHVHDLELVAQDLLEGEVLVEDGVRVFLGVGRVDAVDAGRLEQDLGAQLLAAQRGRGVGRDERAARAGGQDDHAPSSRWDRARRRMNGSATSSMRIVVKSRVAQPSFSSASCRARPLITVAVMPM